MGQLRFYCLMELQTHGDLHDPASYRLNFGHQNHQDQDSDSANKLEDAKQKLEAAQPLNPTLNAGAH